MNDRLHGAFIEPVDYQAGDMFYDAFIDPKTWLNDPKVTAFCQRSIGERLAEEADIRARFEKWAAARNWNLQMSREPGIYDIPATYAGYIAFLAVARGEA